MNSRRQFHPSCKERVAMKRVLVLLVLIGFGAMLVGCEASGKADKEGVKVEVDKK
jgi:hypothetical protein